MSEDMFWLMLTFSLPCNLLIWVHSSLRNLAYLGFCLIASKKGMLTVTFLNISKISLLASFLLLDWVTLWGKGNGTATGSLGGVACSFWLDRLGWLWLFGCVGWEVLGSEDGEGRASTCFPLLKVMALTLSLGLMMVWDGRDLEFYIFCCSLINVTSWPICVLRSWTSIAFIFWMLVIVVVKVSIIFIKASIDGLGSTLGAWVGGLCSGGMKG